MEELFAGELTQQKVMIEALFKTHAQMSKGKAAEQFKSAQQQVKCEI